MTKQDFENTLGKAVRIGTADRDGGPGKMDHRQEQMTVRAGTRGFRAPEVCVSDLKYFSMPPSKSSPA